MELIFKKKELKLLAERYEYQSDDILNEITLSAKCKKYLTKEEFIKFCYWKTPRSKPKVAKNDADFIKEITEISFVTKSDKLRIEILTLLDGVGWPTASTILHFCHEEEFPIIDFRALFSLNCNVKPHNYNYSF